MEQQPFTGTKIVTGQEQTEQEVKSERAVKRGVIDHKILKHALRSTIRNKFSIVWFSVMGAINLIILLIYAFISTFTPTSIFIATLVWFFAFGIMQMIYNLVSLNKVFSMDDEIGIVSLEIRKGRGPAMIFFSRLLGQKIVVWSSMIIYMAIQLIACTLNNHFLLQTKYLFVLAWVPIDLILTGIFLIFFSLKRYRLGVGLGSVLIAIVLATPMTDMINIFLVQSNETISKAMEEDGNIKTYLADKMFQIINKSDNKENNIVYKLMNETNEKSVKNYLTFKGKTDDNVMNNNEVSTVVSAMFYQGVWTDKELFGVDGRLYDLYGSYSDEGKKVFDIDEDSDFAKSVFYEINTKYTSSHPSKSNSDSIYRNVRSYSYSDLQNTISQLENVISFLENDREFGKLDGIKELNDTVLEYANNLFHRPSSYNELQLDDMPIKDIYKLSDYGSYSNNSGKTYMVEGFYTTSPGLRLWNQIVMQMVGNATTYTTPEEFVKPAKYRNLAILNPWAMSLWTMLGGTDKSSVEFNTAIAGGETSNFNYSEMFNYSRFVNTNASNSDSGQSGSNSMALPEFRIDTMEAMPKVKGVKYKTVGHSPAGFNVTITILGLTLIGIAYVLYRVRLRHQ